MLNGRAASTDARLVRIETKLSKLMEYMAVPIKEHDAADVLASAYDIICEFEECINNQLNGDHPYVETVAKWLKSYEARKGISPTC